MRVLFGELFPESCVFVGGGCPFLSPSFSHFLVAALRKGQTQLPGSMAQFSFCSLSSP